MVDAEERVTAVSTGSTKALYLLFIWKSFLLHIKFVLSFFVFRRLVVKKIRETQRSMYVKKMSPIFVSKGCLEREGAKVWASPLYASTQNWPHIPYRRSLISRARTTCRGWNQFTQGWAHLPGNEPIYPWVTLFNQVPAILPRTNPGTSPLTQ